MGKCGGKKNGRSLPESLKSFSSRPIYLFRNRTSAQFAFSLSYIYIYIAGVMEEPGGIESGGFGLRVHIDRQWGRTSYLSHCVWDCVLKLTGYSGVAFQSEQLIPLGAQLPSSSKASPSSAPVIRWLPTRHKVLSPATQTHKFSGGEGGAVRRKPPCYSCYKPSVPEMDVVYTLRNKISSFFFLPFHLLIKNLIRNWGQKFFNYSEVGLSHIAHTSAFSSYSQFWARVLIFN